MQEDYFGFDDTEQVFMPDGKSFLVIQALPEGARRKYLNETNRDIRLNRASGDAILQMRTGDEKHSLLVAAIVGWNFVKRNPTSGEMVPVTFSKKGLNNAAGPGTLEEWLNKANPKHVDLVDKAVRKKNAWLLADMSSEDIAKQIEELTELYETKKKEEEGNASSSPR
jgi:hypothetical protein